jgi:beta-galactosidase
VPYQPGELKVEALENGKVAESRILSTAGEPKALRLTADRQTLKADGEDLAFITLEVVDDKGRFCPLAEDSLQMTVTGAGKLLALGNANIKDTGCYADGTHKAWKGRALAVVRSNRRKGLVHIRVSSPRLGKKEITLRC